ncbi:MAG: methionyl-tRNA formyltransferase [Burkholderiaceae bacterium]
MKVVFAGTPEFAAVALDAILKAAPDAGWTVPLVLTQPDRPAGRGLKLAASPVKQLALAHGIEVDSPVSLRKGDDAVAASARLKAVEPDVLVVAAYGLILPQAVLDIPKWAALNIHASLLPRWRGAAPVVRAIEAGDSTTGITIMQMDAGLDTGPMLMSETIAIAPDDTAATLIAKLSQLGARLIVDALRNGKQLSTTPQTGVASYANKVGKAEAWLDWADSAVALERKVRAFNPFPVAAGSLNGTTIRFWRAQAVDAEATIEAGVVRSVDASGVRVTCGSGELLITELQRSGGKRVTAREFATGFAIKAGDRFVAPSTTASIE